MFLSKKSRFIAVTLLTLALAACESDEERAGAFYESGLELLEQGEVSRAIVEFRNVLAIDENHRDARSLYAKSVLELGETREAYVQYLRLVEQYPDDVDGRVVLSELAFQNNSFEEFERHSIAAVELAPDNPRVQLISLAREYRVATEDEEVEKLDEIGNESKDLIKDNPDSVMLQRILIDTYLRDRDFEAALKQIDEAIALEPTNQRLYALKASIAAELGEDDQLEKVLKQMISLFGDNDDVKKNLISFYMSRDRADDAEAFLRSISDPTAEDLEPFIALVQFITQRRGPEAAIAELDQALVKSPENSIIRAVKAGILFDLGKQDEAVSELQSVLETAEPSRETNRIKLALAKMLVVAGNEVGARRLVEEVIADDAFNGVALKMQATWQIDADEVDAAINSLRAALDGNPQDIQAMSLMARAHIRAGNRELARDFMGLAAETSTFAPVESLQYAKFLIEEGRFLPAEDVLTKGLRTSPNQPELLIELGRLYVEIEDYARAEQVEQSLRNAGNPATVRAADELKIRLLGRREGTANAIQFLEGLAGNDTDLGAKVSLVRARLSSGDLAGALESARAYHEEAPDNQLLRYTLYVTETANGNFEAAEAGFRGLLEDDPLQERIWIELIRTVSIQGEPERASAIVDEALEVLPESPNLLWAKATGLEQENDIDGAIAIYEKLYSQNSESVVVANNLASLLVTHRDDDASVDRAYSVARRLADTQVPAFQDTYGWILYRRGDFEEALRYLEPAASRLQNDPTVQYHLGKVYISLNQNKKAVEQLKRSIEIAEPLNQWPQIEQARQELKKLEETSSE